MNDESLVKKLRALNPDLLHACTKALDLSGLDISRFMRDPKEYPLDDKTRTTCEDLVIGRIGVYHGLEGYGAKRNPEPKVTALPVAPEQCKRSGKKYTDGLTQINRGFCTVLSEYKRLPSDEEMEKRAHMTRVAKQLNEIEEEKAKHPSRIMTLAEAMGLKVNP
nr:hypothetical protein [uncultured Cohaesibacter sp.]